MRTDCEIRVELGKEVRPGLFAFTVPSLQISGKSRQPLLDACREIKRMGGDTGTRQTALYRPGKDHPDMTCGVTWGATHTVDESGPRFRKWQPFERQAL